jgi:hypothetical protein
LLFSFGSGIAKRKCLVDGSENVIKISCYRVLRVMEGRFRDTCLHAKLFVDGWVPLRMARKKQMMPLAVEPNTGKDEHQM